MENAVPDSNEKSPKFVINLISIAVPVVVGVLLAFPNRVDLGAWTKTLPHVIGSVNSLTTLALLLGFLFIRRNRVDLHRLSMLSAFALGGVFLVCYVTYHISNPSNRFSGEGFVRYVYLFILLTHILLSLVVLPLVLRALFYALTARFERHRRIARYAYPIWLYVSVTGVIVYLMLYQLFPNK